MQMESDCIDKILFIQPKSCKNSNLGGIYSLKSSSDEAQSAPKQDIDSDNRIDRGGRSAPRLGLAWGRGVG